MGVDDRLRGHRVRRCGAEGFDAKPISGKVQAESHRPRFACVFAVSRLTRIIADRPGVAMLRARLCNSEPCSRRRGFLQQAITHAGENGRIGWVLVTGASAGIGRELVAAHAVRVKTMPADLGLPGAAEAIAAALGEAGVDVDVLVNNAGVVFEGDFAGVASDDHLRLLQIDVVALTSLTRLFLPPMLKRGGGRILNLASTAAFVPVPHLAVYAAAKAYVLSLTESIAEELRGTGVTATALCPGFTDTAMMRGSQLAKPIPPMMIMSPNEVAELGCAACLKGEAICVPGLANKVIASGAPLMPRT